MGRKSWTLWLMEAILLLNSALTTWLVRSTMIRHLLGIHLDKSTIIWRLLSVRSNKTTITRYLFNSINFKVAERYSKLLKADNLVKAFVCFKLLLRALLFDTLHAFPSNRFSHFIFFNKHFYIRIYRFFIRLTEIPLIRAFVPIFRLIIDRFDFTLVSSCSSFTFGWNQK